MTKKNYSTSDFIMEQLSFEELGLITGGLLEQFLHKSASPDNDPPKPYFP